MPERYSFNLSPERPASDAQYRYLRDLMEQLDRVPKGTYATMDMDAMTSKEIGTRISQLKARLDNKKRANS